jgi:hypothetical protein
METKSFEPNIFERKILDNHTGNFSRGERIIYLWPTANPPYAQRII